MNTESENKRSQKKETEDAAIDLAADSMEQAAATDGSTVEQLKSQLADAEKRVLMAHADLDNFRRRTRRDMQDQIRYAPLELISELLESVDNLQRAIESYETEPNGEGLVEGVRMVAQQISTTLENHGCKRIEAVGKPFRSDLAPGGPNAAE